MRFPLLTLTLCAFCLGLCAPVFAQDEAYTAVTTEDPLIPRDELTILVEPLTNDQLAVEAEAWMGLVQAQARKIARKELLVKRTNKEIASKKETGKAAKEAQKAAEKVEELKEQAAAGDEKAAEQATKLEQKATAAAAKAQQAAEEAAQAEEVTRALEEEDAAETAAEAQGAAEEEAASATADDEAETAPETPEAPTAQEVAQTAAQAAEAGANVEATARAAEAAEQAVAAVAQQKTDNLTELNELRDRRTALIDRTRVVLDEYEKKGGEIEDYERYLKAVSGMKLDVDDTSAAWMTITGWLKSEEGGIRWGKNLAFFMLTLVFFFIVARVVGKAVERGLRVSKGMSRLMREFLGKSVRRVILAIGVVVAITYLEVEVAPLLAVIGAAGFVIAFALQDTLSNFASGIMILLYRPFDVGDIVEVADVSGTVAALNLVSTTINTFDNKVIVVPNNSIWNNVITNATGSRERRVDLVFGIGYADSIADAQGILEDVVRNHPLVLKTPEPNIKVNELGDSSVNFIVRPWVKTEDYWTVYWDLTRSVKEAFDQNGITIPYPQRDVHVVHSNAGSVTAPEQFVGSPDD